MVHLLKKKQQRAFHIDAPRERISIMFLIACPWCGERDQSEFAYGGEAAISRPVDPDAASDETWGTYLFFRDNTKGPITERWVHAFGCRRWFNAVRDTRTNTFIATSAPVPKLATPIGWKGS
jgi:heterotetrameric sarcosine oxidase delta subunit